MSDTMTIDRIRKVKAEAEAMNGFPGTGAMIRLADTAIALDTECVKAKNYMVELSEGLGERDKRIAFLEEAQEGCHKHVDELEETLAFHDMTWEQAGDTINELKAENARLRDAMQDLIDSLGVNPPTYGECALDNCIAALKGEQE